MHYAEYIIEIKSTKDLILTSCLFQLHYIENYEAKALVMWEIPNCSSPCNLNNFLEAITSVIPSDWDTECQLN